MEDQIVPALVILVANILSGPHGSLRWEMVTALFGWMTVLALAGWIVTSLFPVLEPARSWMIQLMAFCFLTALSRDYEKILKPVVDALIERRRK